MDNINIFEIIDNSEILNNDFLFEVNNLECGTTFLLDFEKEKYTPLEKYIYDIACYHFKRLNIELTSNVFVEFWHKIKDSTNNFHVDCDEILRSENNIFVYPLLSCVNYLNTNNIPTVITNVDKSIYIYKDFEKETKLFFSFPVKNKQLTFDKIYSTKMYYNIIYPNV